MIEVFIGIGSNLGDRFEAISDAVSFLGKEAIQKIRISPLLETEALVLAGSPKEWNLPYLNLVVRGETKLAPRQLLLVLKRIEGKLGRDFGAPRWSPRAIDLDILAYGEGTIEEEDLCIPHLELMNRPFFVHQMAFLQPGWRYPRPGCVYSGKPLAEILHSYISLDVRKIKTFSFRPRLVGIVNITPDSFSDGGRYLDPDCAVRRVVDLAEQGAAVVEIGACSTRPGALKISAEEEWLRLHPVLERLDRIWSGALCRPKFSLDSFSAIVAEKALRYEWIDWLNDVSGKRDPLLYRIVKEAGKSLVITHSLGAPPSKESIISLDRDPIEAVCQWAQKIVVDLLEMGFQKERIILDPGIGFGKTPMQSFAILQRIKELKDAECKILVGHSKKGFLKTVSRGLDLDLETLGVSFGLREGGVDFLRVHDVEAHHRLFAAFEAVKR